MGSRRTCKWTDGVRRREERVRESGGRRVSEGGTTKLKKKKREKVLVVDACITQLHKLFTLSLSLCFPPALSGGFTLAARPEAFSGAAGEPRRQSWPSWNTRCWTPSFPQRTANAARRLPRPHRSQQIGWSARKRISMSNTP